MRGQSLFRRQKNSGVLVQNFRNGFQRLGVHRAEGAGGEIPDFGTPQAPEQLQLGFDLFGQFAALLEQVFRVHVKDCGNGAQRLIRNHLLLARLQQRPPGAGKVIAGFLGTVPDGRIVIGLARFGHNDVQKEIDLPGQRFGSPKARPM